MSTSLPTTGGKKIRSEEDECWQEVTPILNLDWSVNGGNGVPERIYVGVLSNPQGADYDEEAARRCYVTFAMQTTGNKMEIRYKDGLQKTIPGTKVPDAITFTQPLEALRGDKNSESFIRSLKTVFRMAFIDKAHLEPPLPSSEMKYFRRAVKLLKHHEDVEKAKTETNTLPNSNPIDRPTTSRKTFAPVPLDKQTADHLKKFFIPSSLELKWRPSETNIFVKTERLVAEGWQPQKALKTLKLFCTLTNPELDGRYQWRLGEVTEGTLIRWITFLMEFGTPVFLWEWAFHEACFNALLENGVRFHGGAAYMARVKRTSVMTGNPIPYHHVEIEDQAKARAFFVTAEDISLGRQPNIEKVYEKVYNVRRAIEDEEEYDYLDILKRLENPVGLTSAARLDSIRGILEEYSRSEQKKALKFAFGWMANTEASITGSQRNIEPTKTANNQIDRPQGSFFGLAKGDPKAAVFFNPYAILDKLQKAKSKEMKKKMPPKDDATIVAEVRAKLLPLFFYQKYAPDMKIVRLMEGRE